MTNAYENATDLDWSNPGNTDSGYLMELDIVRRYMEGTGEHPGFLLPWEELREGPSGRRYFFDLVTSEITWWEDKDDKIVLLNTGPKRPLRWHAKRVIPGETIEEQELYLSRREAFVDYWRYYVSTKGQWPLVK
jgi:hypothetical protein